MTAISIHAARVGSDVWAHGFIPGDAVISIHAARVGSDFCTVLLFCLKEGISIHAARVGSDMNFVQNKGKNLKFQSTLPEWAATAIDKIRKVRYPAFQSTLPEWAAT